MQKKVAAKPLQSCSTLCDPIDAAHQAPPIPGILQARVLEWGATAFSEIGGTSDLSPYKRPTVRVGSTTYLLFLSVTPQDEWRLHDLPEGKQHSLNSRERERELYQQFSEVWAEDNSPQACKISPTGNRTQTRYNYVSTCLLPNKPCLAVYSLRD